MVFESLINPIKAEKHPVHMLFIGALYSSFAILLSLFVFSEDASLVMIFLTTLAAVPVMYGAIKLEEKKDLLINNEGKLLKEHAKALTFFMLLFIGFVLSFAAWNLLLPEHQSTNLFSTQNRDIKRVEMASSIVTGNAINHASAFGVILANNLKVMVFALLFSFFYGFGAIFILSWNASVIGAAIGNFVRATMGGGIIAASITGLFRYLLHGIPEILAYFTVGLAGGIISIAIIRHDFGSNKFKRVLVDSFGLIGISVGLIIVAAALEVFVTPIFF